MMTNKDEEQIDLEQSDEISDEVQLSEVDQLRQELEEATEAKLRTLADFKNFQRRSVDNESRAVSSGITRVVKAIIPALEQMNMAIEHANDDAVVQGFSMAKNELIRGLTECGVSLINPEVGDHFDPHLHEAMMRQETEGMGPDHIITVIQQGYGLGEIIISPAKVAIST